MLNNKIFSGIAALGMMLLGMASCDDIDEAERVTQGDSETMLVMPGEVIAVIDGETFAFLDQHVLLIEDFTGWNCVNCPTIADYLTTQITKSFPSVLVSLHMTTNSFSKGHPDGYNCASADSIANMLYGSAVASQLPLPSVAIDQVATEDGISTSNTTLLGKLALERFTAFNIEKSAPQVEVAINVTDKGSDSYAISTYVNCPLSNYNLKLWLIEEGLISRVQNSTSGYLRDYENHGILRMVINGDCRGENLSKDEHLARHNLNISGKGYKAENCRVVAIVSDATTNEVLNCAKVELVK